MILTWPTNSVKTYLLICKMGITMIVVIFGGLLQKLNKIIFVKQSALYCTWFFPNRWILYFLGGNRSKGKNWHHTQSAFSSFPLLCFEVEVEAPDLISTSILVFFPPSLSLELWNIRATNKINFQFPRLLSLCKTYDQIRQFHPTTGYVGSVSYIYKEWSTITVDLIWALN